MASAAETAQLPLSVSVSSWSGVLHNIKKAGRYFRYTPFVQVLSHFLFWVNVGVVGGMYLLMQSKQQYISSGIGVVFIPGSKSSIPLFAASSVRNLTELPYIWYGMIVVMVTFTLVSMIVHNSGRYGMTSYLLAVSLLLLVLMAKVMLLPLLLIGG